MARDDRKPELQFQIHRLERKHTELAARVAELESHLFLSTNEQLLMTALKKEKLAAKDALVGLRRRD
jgi:hypothetical protein